jgi:hypothetical protein
MVVLLELSVNKACEAHPFSEPVSMAAKHASLRFAPPSKVPFLATPPNSFFERALLPVLGRAGAP